MRGGDGPACPTLRRLCSPGDYLKPGEDDAQGLRSRLHTMLDSPDGSTGSLEDWEIGDCLAQWWRPHFETFLVRRECTDLRGC